MTRIIVMHRRVLDAGEPAEREAQRGLFVRRRCPTRTARNRSEPLECSLRVPTALLWARFMLPDQALRVEAHRLQSRVPQFNSGRRLHLILVASARSGARLAPLATLEAFANRTACAACSWQWRIVR